jgi:hypothetical protein
MKSTQSNVFTMIFKGWDDDYDDGSEDSGASQDWDLEPGDDGWGAYELDD